jgi:hypothetical protein
LISELDAMKRKNHGVSVWLVRRWVGEMILFENEA